MAEQAAKALNDLMHCNMHGVGTVDQENLLQFALDYFEDEHSVESEGEDDGIDEVVNLPDAPELAGLMEELDSLNQDGENDSVSDSDEDDSNDGPNILVDEAKQVLDQNADTIVSPNADIEHARIRDFDCGCSVFKA